MIPKVIHQIWLGSELPDHLQVYVNSWRDTHPDWVFKWWTEKNLPELPVDIRLLYNSAGALYQDRRKYQFQSDLLRYVILERKGGVYVDTDFECLRPIDDLLDCAGFLSWEDQDRWLCNAIIGCEPHSPFMRVVIDGLMMNVANGSPQDSPAKLTGPQYLTRKFEQQKPEGWITYPQDMFYPYSWRELYKGRLTFLDAYAVHHWENRRVRTGTKR